MDEELTAAEEVELLRQNGVQGMADLFSRYQDRLLRMVSFRLDRRMLGRVDPADILQESYMEASRRLPEFIDNPAVPFFVWLRQKTLQVMIDSHRRHIGAKMRDVSQEVPLQQRAFSPASSMSLAAQLVDSVTSPSQAAMRDELLVELRAALDSMDKIDREVLALRHFEELSNNEVAHVLGLQKSAASNRYVRALKRLRQIMNKLGDQT